MFSRDHEKYLLTIEDRLRLKEVINGFAHTKLLELDRDDAISYLQDHEADLAIKLEIKECLLREYFISPSEKVVERLTEKAKKSFDEKLRIEEQLYGEDYDIYYDNHASNWG